MARNFEEELRQEPAEDDPMDAYAKSLSRRCRVYNTDKTDMDLDACSRAVLKPRRKTGLWLLLLGLLALIGWFLWQQGVIPW